MGADVGACPIVTALSFLNWYGDVRSAQLARPTTVSVIISAGYLGVVVLSQRLPNLHDLSVGVKISGPVPGRSHLEIVTRKNIRYAMAGHESGP